VRRALAALATVLALTSAASLTHVEVNGTIAKAAQSAAEQERSSQPSKDGGEGDGGGGFPIWAGIGLMLLAAVAGSAAARARNRRRMRDYMSGD
jgi:hypothetical protein